MLLEGKSLESTYCVPSILHHGLGCMAGRILSGDMIYFRTSAVGKKRSRVVVEAAPTLPTQHPGRDHAAEQGRRRVFLLVKLAQQHVGDIQHGVQADKVGKGERTHGEAAA